MISNTSNTMPPDINKNPQTVKTAIGIIGFSFGYGIE